jgi:hypothetical protein
LKLKHTGYYKLQLVQLVNEGVKRGFYEVYNHFLVLINIWTNPTFVYTYKYIIILRL